MTDLPNLSPVIPGVLQNIIPPQDSMEATSLARRDPWDWSVDDVVASLCSRTHPVLSSMDPRSLPDPTLLEKALRDNGVSGPTLLTAVDTVSVRDDLGLRALGHRNTILRLIDALKNDSPKYVAQVMSTSSSRFDRTSSTDRQNGYGSPYHGSPFYVTPRAASTASELLQSPTAPSGQLQHLMQASSGNVQRTVEQPQNVLLQGPVLLPPDRQSVPLTEPREKSGNSSSSSHSTNVYQGMGMNGNPEAIGFNAKEEKMTESSAVANRHSTNLGPVNRPGENYVTDDVGRKRRRLVLVPQSDDTPDINRFVSVGGDGDVAAEHLQRSESSGVVSKGFYAQVDDDNQYLQEHGSTMDNETFDTSALRDSEEHHGPSEPDGAGSTTSHELHEAGTSVVDAHGRKRMKPILISQAECDVDVEAFNDTLANFIAIKNVEMPLLSSPQAEIVSAFTKNRKIPRKSEQTYLGLEPFAVDKIFYGNTAFGKELSNDMCYEHSPYLEYRDNMEIFFFNSRNQVSHGQRQYVNAQMRHFLHSSRAEPFHHNGQKLIGVVPYPNKIGKLHQPLSMTLFRRSQKGVIATRVDRSDWLENDLHRRSSRVNDGELSSARLSTNANQPFVQNDGVDSDWEYLQKWKYAEVNDKVLPLYGDSGSDGEYDSATLLEIEKETGRTEPAKGKRRPKILSDQAVQREIHEVLIQMVGEWHEKRAPKLQSKAWRLWNKSKQDRNEREEVEKLTDAVKKLDDRLVKLREGIAKEKWTALQNLNKQCKIMQPSVFDREECNWKISVLKLEKSPDKPPPSLKRPKATRLQSPGKSLRGNQLDPARNSHDSESSDGDSDGFIVDDDVSARGDDSPMANIEDEEASKPLLADKECVSSQRLSVEKEIKAAPHTPERTGNQSILRLRSKALSAQKPDIIDLTQQSGSEEPYTHVKAEPFRALCTPPLHPSDEDDPFKRSRMKKPHFKHPPVASEIITIETDSAYSTAKEDDQGQEVLPGLQEIDKITRLDPQMLVERGDRKRLLLWHISKTPARRRKLIFKYLEQSYEDMRRQVEVGLKILESHGQKIRGADKDDSDAVLQICGWYVCWTIPVIVNSTGIKERHMHTALADLEDGFALFYEFLLICPKHYGDGPINATIPVEPASPTAVKKRKKLFRDNSNENLQDLPYKKRKYVVPESQQALELRSTAEERVRAREERQKELKRRFKKMGANVDMSKVLVNPGKFEHQDFVYLHPSIGDRIQPHQREGVQFMWREIVTDHDTLQGCLLAQTMGLGKTMQVITLLVTIAEAARSQDETIRNQIPPGLRRSQTLILCPPALIENWWDEFLMWTPMPTANDIGEIRKITPALNAAERLYEIKAWTADGGVLIMGFNAFRAYIVNKVPKKGGEPPLDKVDYEMVKEALLERPAIIVADEAHAMKNAASGLNAAMSRIKSTSRIALTGSPLSNNLGEYYSLIDWIAPNYLGARFEFKANYEEPIQEGLYQDSTDLQYRHSLKKLAALMRILEPKTHRADISVLKGKLKEKQEFVVRVPLTKLQEEIYRIYVEGMLSVSGENEPNTTTLWAWLAILRLLCNHPKCFMDKLLERKQEGGKLRTSFEPKEKAQDAFGEVLVTLDGDDSLLDQPVSEVGISQSMVEKQLSPFDSLTEPLESITLAYKMQILMDILQFSLQADDKVLVFSHSIPTLDYAEDLLIKSSYTYSRIDGQVKPMHRQQLTKNFNSGTVNVFLISTKAGGQGLNLFGANRVVILDDSFNPMWEEQAIGRAYRIGQNKPVYVYHLIVAGTFEESIQNQSLFKQQLAKRVVDRKNPVRHATKGVGQYLFLPKNVKQQDLDQFMGKDTLVLDRILSKYEKNPIIRSMDLTETFHEEDTVELTAEEKQEAEQMQKDEQLRRRDPVAYSAIAAARRVGNVPSRRFLATQTNPWAAHSARKTLNAQGASTIGTNEYTSRFAKHSDLAKPPASMVVRASGGSAFGHEIDPMSQVVESVPDPQSIMRPGLLPILGSNTMTQPHASPSPEKQPQVASIPQRGASEPSDTLPVTDHPKSPRGPYEPPTSNEPTAPLNVTSMSIAPTDSTSKGPVSPGSSTTEGPRTSSRLRDRLTIPLSRNGASGASKIVPGNHYPSPIGEPDESTAAQDFSSVALSTTNAKPELPTTSHPIISDRTRSQKQPSNNQTAPTIFPRSQLKRKASATAEPTMKSMCSNLLQPEAKRASNSDSKS